MAKYVLFISAVLGGKSTHILCRLKPINILGLFGMSHSFVIIHFGRYTSVTVLEISPSHLKCSSYRLGLCCKTFITVITQI